MTDIVAITEVELEQNAKILELRFQGETELAIARRLNLPRKDVVRVVEDWKNSPMVHEEMGERVHELLRELDHTYETIIKSQWEVVASVDAHSNPSATLLAAKNTALKNVADYHDKRIQVLQRSGLLDNEDLAADLAEMERQRDAIIDILDHDLCDICQPKVARKIGELMQQAKPLVIAG